MSRIGFIRPLTIHIAALALAGVAAAQFPLAEGELVASCGIDSLNGPIGSPYVLGIVDARDPDCAAGAVLGDNWLAPMYHNEMPNPTMNPADEWTETNLGSVFGLTLDNAVPPNIYTTSTTAYVNVVGDGRVNKIDGITGAISTFATLPNSGQGLGNIAFDNIHRQFFVTNHEDGMIYRLDMSGVTLDTFDPFAADDGVPGFCPLGERLWGIATYDERLYFARWTEDLVRPDPAAANEIWSVAIDPVGSLVPADLTLEITLPPNDARDHSNPVSDITFSLDDRMMVAERTMASDDSPSAHDSRVLEYTGDHLTWAPSASVYQVGLYGTGVNSAGGVAYDCIAELDACNSANRVWVMADAIWFDPAAGRYLYGLQGLPDTGGLVADSYLIDLDADTLFPDKASVGEVDVYRNCNCAVAPTAVPAAADAICQGDQARLDGSASSAVCAVLEYRWLAAGTPVCGWSSSPTCDVVPAATTNYTLEVRCDDDHACLASAEVEVEVSPIPIATLTAPVVCLGDELTLDASGSDPNGCPSPPEYLFLEEGVPVQGWGPANTYGPFAPAGPATYTVAVACGDCEHSVDLDITVVPPPEAEAGADVVACVDDPVTLNAWASLNSCPAGALYEWWEGPVLMRAALPQSTFTPPGPAAVGTRTYRVVVTCAGVPGCSSEDPVTVTLRECTLAVTFDSLEAIILNDRRGPTVAVRWRTLSEDGTRAFVIERAPGRDGPWRPIGPSVAATGSGSSYEVLDPDGLDASSAPWYRIVERTMSGIGDTSPGFPAVNPGGPQPDNARHRARQRRSLRAPR